MLGRDLGCGKGKGWPQGRGRAAQTPTAQVHGCGHPFGQGRPSDCIIPGWPSPSYRNPEEMNRMKSGEGTDTPTPHRLMKNHSTPWLRSWRPHHPGQVLQQHQDDLGMRCLEARLDSRAPDNHTVFPRAYVTTSERAIGNREVMLIRYFVPESLP